MTVTVSVVLNRIAAVALRRIDDNGMLHPRSYYTLTVSPVDY